MIHPATVGQRSASGLFHRAILQSGGGERFTFDGREPNSRTYAASRELIARLGGGDAEDLRRVPSDWPAYGDGGRIAIIDGVPAQGRIDDEPVVLLQHAARTR